MIKHILFDLDHTLWDFETNSNIAMRELYRNYDLKRYFSSYEAFHNTYLAYNTQLWADYAKNIVSKTEVSVGRFYKPLINIGIDDYQLATEMANFYLEATSRRKHLLPFALETIRRLHRNYHLHIATNGFKEVQYKKIATSGIGRYIDNIFISEEIGAMKPTKQFFEYIFKKLKTNVTECIMVGDNPESDIRGAMEIGMRSVLYNSRNIECPFSVETIYSLRELSV